MIFYNSIYICLSFCCDWFPPADNFWRNVNNAMSAMSLEFPIPKWVHCSYSSLVSRYLETEFPGSLQESNRWWVVINDSCGSGGRWSVSGISLSSPAASNAEYTTGLYGKKKQEQDCSSVVKKSIIYYIDYTRVLFFYVTIYFFYNIFRYECFIRDNDPYRDGSKTGPCSLVRLRYVFCFPAIFASRSLLECSPQHGGCVQCSVLSVASTRQLLLPATAGAMNLAQCHWLQTPDKTRSLIKCHFSMGKELYFINGRHNCTSS